ncbi:MAG: hypothetical protein R3E03_04985 [Novosphingobium sp.]
MIGGQVSAGAIVTRLIVPSIVNLLVPLVMAGFLLRGKPLIAPKNRSWNRPHHRV